MLDELSSLNEAGPGRERRIENVHGPEEDDLAAEGISYTYNSTPALPYTDIVLHNRHDPPP